MSSKFFGYLTYVFVLIAFVTSGCKSDKSAAEMVSPVESADKGIPCGTNSTVDEKNPNCSKPKLAAPTIESLGDIPIVLTCAPRLIWSQNSPFGLSVKTKIQIVRVADNSVVFPWTDFASNPMCGLSLQSVTSYKIQLRNTDATGLLSDIVTSPEWSAGVGVGTWSAVSSVNAPSQREFHTTVWTGSKMLVWGGQDSSSSLNTGAIYDPSSDTWTAMSLTNAPSARSDAAGVWSGTEMIIWGGNWNRNGGRYNPVANTWRGLSTVNSPIGVIEASAVWTGSKMIVWGGQAGNGNPRIWSNEGGIYNPATDTWTAMSTVGAPSPREQFAMVFTGSKLIIWGGMSGWNSVTAYSGGVYDPVTDSWTTINTAGAPNVSGDCVAAWTGTEMLTRCGRASAVSGYNPTTDRWTTYSKPSNPWDLSEINILPATGSGRTWAWSGTKLFVWGGYAGFGITNSGGLYDPALDSWTGTKFTNAPAPAVGARAIWTGSKFILWGSGVSASYAPL